MTVNYAQLLRERLPKPKPERTVVTLRMDQSLRDELQAIANEQRTSLSEVCVALLTTDVMIYEHQKANQVNEGASDAQATLAAK